MVLRQDLEASALLNIRAVADRVCQLIDSVTLTPTYRTALVNALKGPGRVLSDTPEGRWTQCVSSCCIAAGGRWEQAVPTAATLELLMTALELLDDLEDGETGPLHSELGTARVLNVATGLLLLAQQQVLALDCDGQTASILIAWVLRACSGQDADLGTESGGGIDIVEALEVTELKSASLVAAACQLGALCAGADPPVQALYARFGSYLGMIAQLVNDMRAVTTGTTGKTDMALHRPTLPLVFAARQSSGATEHIDDWSDAACTLGPAPIALTWVVAETYRGRALDLIPSLTIDPIARDALVRLVREL